MIGTTLGHYRIESELGKGGMGVVYKARDLHLDRFVALKVLPPEKVSDPDRKRRFVQEAKAASALNHPNIVTIHDISSDRGVDFIAMELVDGKTLEHIIGRGTIPLKETLRYAVQIADALAAAHNTGIVHRDLKPGNIMVAESGRVRVVDFGLAKLGESGDGTGNSETDTQSQRMSVEGMVVGTIAYMSPEQAEGKKLDARSDIFSFGSVLYEMLTGRQAFAAGSKLAALAAVLHQEPEPLGADVPEAWRRLVMRCLQKNPARRFHHAEDLKLALEE